MTEQTDLNKNPDVIFNMFQKQEIDYESTIESPPYFTDLDGLKNKLERNGVAVIPNVLSTEECSAMRDGFWEHFTRVLPSLKRNDPRTWREIFKLNPKHGMLIQQYQAGVFQAAIDIRQNPKDITLDFILNIITYSDFSNRDEFNPIYPQKIPIMSKIQTNMFVVVFCSCIVFARYIRCKQTPITRSVGDSCCFFMRFLFL